jgi:hypothetical protein
MKLEANLVVHIVHFQLKSKLDQGHEDVEIEL